jgi:hypothetical protein
VLSSGAPSADLTVVLSGPTLDMPRSTETDRNGAFTFRDVPPGMYTITVSERASNRAMHVEPCFIVDPAAVFSLRLTIDPPPRNARCDAATFGTAILDVTVREEGGGQMQGVRIAAKRNAGCSFHRIERTNEAGELHLYAIPKGRYVVYARSKYFDQRSEVTLETGANAMTIEFPEGTSEAEALIDERKVECNCVARPLPDQ